MKLETKTHSSSTSATNNLDYEAHAERSWKEMQQLRGQLGLRLFQPVEQASRPKGMSKKRFDSLIRNCRKLNALYLGATSLAAKGD